MHPLDPAALMTSLSRLVPNGEKLSSAEAMLAALLHTAMAGLGFLLTQLDEHLPLIPDSKNVLPEDWAKHGPSYYSFCYKHDKGCTSYLLKVTKLGHQTSVDAKPLKVRSLFYFHCASFLIGTIQDGEPVASFSFSTSSFISPEFFSDIDIDNTSLARAFHSSDEITELVDMLKLEIVSRILPASYEEGGAEQPGAASASHRRPEGQPPLCNPPTVNPLPINPQHPPGLSHLPAWFRRNMEQNFTSGASPMTQRPSGHNGSSFRWGITFNLPSHDPHHHHHDPHGRDGHRPWDYQHSRWTDQHHHWNNQHPHWTDQRHHWNNQHHHSVHDSDHHHQHSRVEDSWGHHHH